MRTSPEQSPRLLTASKRFASLLALFCAFLLPVLFGFLAETTDRAHAESIREAPEERSPNNLVIAAGPVRGVGALGYGPPAESAPLPRPAYGGSPGDYARGYEGMSPIPQDPWHREADFRNRNYSIRQQSPPSYATPSQAPAGSGGRVIEPYDPVLPKPPLPGDSDPTARVRPVAPGSASAKKNAQTKK